MLKEIRNLGLILCLVVIVCFSIYKFAFEPKTDITFRTMGQEKTSMIAIASNLASQRSFSFGPEDAKVTVVEFFDPECESCASVAPYIKNEMKFYEGKVRWVFRYMAYHKNSKNAIRVLEAARMQNLFLEAQHLLFENQKVWGEQQISTEKEILALVSQLKTLDKNKLESDMKKVAVDEIVNLDMEEGKKAGVTGTPTFFVNGAIVESLDLDLLLKRINAHL